MALIFGELQHIFPIKSENDIFVILRSGSGHI